MNKYLILIKKKIEFYNFIYCYYTNDVLLKNKKPKSKFLIDDLIFLCALYFF